jgi:hypothetical protein
VSAGPPWRRRAPKSSPWQGACSTVVRA